MSNRKDILEGLEGYTPGPWEISVWANHMRDAGEPSGIYTVETSWDEEQGEVPTDEVEICDIPQWCGAREEQRANAQLIRCAPDLVKEIKLLRSGLRDAIRALKENRIPKGGNLLSDLQALLPNTVNNDG